MSLRKMIGGWIGRFWLWLFGWKLEGEFTPELKRCVIIIAPHTSAWDAPFLLAGAWVLGVDVTFLSKAEIFDTWLVGSFLRACGAMPVDRFDSHGVVGKVVDLFRGAETMRVGVAPEGTRQWEPYWRSGFYHVAVEANVPLAFAFVDFGRRRVGLGPPYHPTGDVVSDMSVIRGFYRDIQGFRPERQGPIRLREEEA